MVRPLWLTPAQDRLFIEGGVGPPQASSTGWSIAAEPAHAGAVSAYEKALRERMRLLVDGPTDPAWLDGPGGPDAAHAGAAIGVRPQPRPSRRLQAEIDSAAPTDPFPAGSAWPSVGRMGNLGPGGGRPSRGHPPDRLGSALGAARPRDAAAGRALAGPHRTDLLVELREKNRPAAQGSTGEQKALILNLVLAQAARLARAFEAPNPILLLDEVAAHLDRRRRAALFDEIVALGLQAFLTGTDRALFEDLVGRAMGVQVDAAALTIVE